MAKQTNKSRKMTFDEWKAAANEAASAQLPELGDIFAEDDPYDLSDSAFEEFGNGTNPADFFEQAFEEDLARQAGDEAERTEAEEREGEEG
jgi:hypothetical protein